VRSCTRAPERGELDTRNRAPAGLQAAAKTRFRAPARRPTTPARSRTERRRWPSASGSSTRVRLKRRMNSSPTNLQCTQCSRARPSRTPILSVVAAAERDAQGSAVCAQPAGKAATRSARLGFLASVVHVVFRGVAVVSLPQSARRSLRDLEAAAATEKPWPTTT
jgi:hypothetical protein